MKANWRCERGLRFHAVRFYAVTSTVSGRAIELFPSREEAEAMLDEEHVRNPDAFDVFTVEAIELEAGEVN